MFKLKSIQFFCAVGFGALSLACNQLQATKPEELVPAAQAYLEKFTPQSPLAAAAASSENAQAPLNSQPLFPHLVPLPQNIYEPLLQDVRAQLQSSDNPMEKALDVMLDAKIQMGTLNGLDILDAHFKAMAYRTPDWKQDDRTLLKILATQPMVRKLFDCSPDVNPTDYAAHFVGQLFPQAHESTTRTFFRQNPVCFLPVCDAEHLFDIKTLNRTFWQNIYLISCATDANKTYDIHGLKASAMGHQYHDTTHAAIALRARENAVCEAVHLPNTFETIKEREDYAIQQVDLLQKRLKAFENAMFAISKGADNNNVLQAALFWVGHEAFVWPKMNTLSSDLHTVWKEVLTEAQKRLDNREENFPNPLEKYATPEGTLASIEDENLREEAKIAIPPMLYKHTYGVLPNKYVDYRFPTWEIKTTDGGLMVEAKYISKFENPDTFMISTTLPGSKFLLQEMASFQSVIDLAFGCANAYQSPLPAEDATDALKQAFFKEKIAGLKALLQLADSKMQLFLASEEGQAIQKAFKEAVEATDASLKDMTPPYPFGDTEKPVENAFQTAAANLEAQLEQQREDQKKMLAEQQASLEALQKDLAAKQQELAAKQKADLEALQREQEAKADALLKKFSTPATPAEETAEPTPEATKADESDSSDAASHDSDPDELESEDDS
ncbi:MAG: hypothetical protein V6Z78_04660 [Holosporaceae bacterium]